MKKIVYVLFCLVLVLGCRKDGRERLFTMEYPNFDFELQAGLNPAINPTYFFNGVDSRIEFYLAQNNIDSAVIFSIDPVVANLSSLNGINFDFLEAVSVRICPAGPEPCSQFDEAFYLDDMIGRSYQVIRLLPSLRSFKALLTDEKYRMEVVFTMYDIPPATIDCRLDMVFEAVQ